MTEDAGLSGSAPPEWRIALEGAIGDRLRGRRSEIEAALSLDPTDLPSASRVHEGRVILIPIIDTAVEELEGLLLRVAALHVAIDRAPSKAEMRRTIRRLIAERDDIAESQLRAAGPDLLELLGGVWPGSPDPPVAVMVADQATLRQVLGYLAEALGSAHRGRDRGQSLAAAQLGLGLAELFARFANAPPSRRSRTAAISEWQQTQEEYGPFFEFCQIAVEILDRIVPARRADAKRQSKLSAATVARGGIGLLKARLAQRHQAADGPPPDPARLWLVDPHLVSRSYLGPPPVASHRAKRVKKVKKQRRIKAP
jgi:hypothetical protein